MSRSITFFILLVLFFYCSNSLIISQVKDSTQSSDDKEFWNEVWGDDDFLDIFSVNMPTIEISYGIMSLNADKNKFSGEFSDSFNGEVKLGFTKIKSSFNSPDILRYDFNYIFLSNLSQDLGSNTINSNEIPTKTWRFGIAQQSGYGYRLGESSNIMLYNGGGLIWTDIEFESNNPELENLKNTYQDAFRFGSVFEGGIRANIINPVGINIGYEATVVYPRHLFWYWAVSGITEAAGQGLLDSFISRILRASPEAGPIANFVLKNALSYGFYKLRSSSMNWPISTAEPFTFEGVKVGLTFSF